MSSFFRSFLWIGLVIVLTTACSSGLSMRVETPGDAVVSSLDTDPDGDGLPNDKELAWGTDPRRVTSFRDLTQIEQTKTVTLRVSHPFAFVEGDPTELDLDELNSTIYQYVNPESWTIDDHGTPDQPDDDHLAMEVVLFPQAVEDLAPMPVVSWPIDPDVYPAHVRLYLESDPDDVSAISDELRETMLQLVNGTGDVYDHPAATDVEAVNRILDWNQVHIRTVMADEAYWIEKRSLFLPQTWITSAQENDVDPFPRYHDLVHFRAPNLFEQRVTRACITKATLFAAELRAVGIPVKIAHHVSSRCNPDEPGCAGMTFSNHFQNLVYLGYTWTLRDFDLGDQVRVADYADYVLTDGFRDNSEAIFTPWFNVADLGIGTWSDLFQPLEASGE